MRVYQAHNDSSHTVGCDTEEYPTRDFIKANHERYKSPDDDHVMLPVQKGGGACRSVSQFVTWLVGWLLVLGAVSE